jgi:hypothetical protein
MAAFVIDALERYRPVLLLVLFGTTTLGTDGLVGTETGKGFAIVWTSFLSENQEVGAVQRS